MKQHPLSSKIAVLKYRNGSKSARALQIHLTEKLKKNVLSIRSDRVPLCKPTRFLVNWGSNDALPMHINCTIINKPSAVASASDKLRSFELFKQKEVSHPEWTTNFDTAVEWVREGHTAFCRTLTRANSGRGIVIATAPDEVVGAPLYTKYIKKKKEFRVHVFQTDVIDIQEKRKREGVDEANFLIRNLDNGFVFCRDNIVEPADLRTTAIQAVSALGLDFGAVDIVYNEHYNKCYTLEVNTAPGLEGTTLESYSNAIIKRAYE
jgi:glutathione synthase/RimK-type ligase-like ATP-grasp enzyme